MKVKSSKLAVMIALAAPLGVVMNAVAFTPSPVTACLDCVANVCFTTSSGATDCSYNTDGSSCQLAGDGCHS